MEQQQHRGRASIEPRMPAPRDAKQGPLSESTRVLSPNSLPTIKSAPSDVPAFRSWLTGRVGDREPAANSFGKEVCNFSVTRNRLGVACLRILPQGVLFALAPHNASVPTKVSQQSFALHPTTTSSWLASTGSERSDSSRRCSRMSVMASRRLARLSSRDLPWPFAPGTSAQYAMYHGPSFSTIAVNSLRMLHSIAGNSAANASPRDASHDRDAASYPKCPRI